jgi:hypothetical protein
MGIAEMPEVPGVNSEVHLMNAGEGADQDTKQDTTRIVTLEATHIEYIGNGMVSVTNKTASGEPFIYVSSVAALVKTINLAISCVNRNLTDIVSNISKAF